jgi:hypothetical protein
MGPRVEPAGDKFWNGVTGFVTGDLSVANRANLSLSAAQRGRGRGPPERSGGGRVRWSRQSSDHRNLRCGNPPHPPNASRWAPPSPPATQAERGGHRLLPDAELAEDEIENIVDADAAGDAAQRAGGEAEVFGQELGRLAVLLQRAAQRSPAIFQAQPMAFPRHDRRHSGTCAEPFRHFHFQVF